MKVRYVDRFPEAPRVNLVDGTIYDVVDSMEMGEDGLFYFIEMGEPGWCRTPLIVNRNAMTCSSPKSQLNLKRQPAESMPPLAGVSSVTRVRLDGR